MGRWHTPVTVDWSSAAIRKTLTDPAMHVGPGLAWLSSSDEEAELVAHFGGDALGERRSFALGTLMFGLPRVTVLSPDAVEPHEGYRSLVAFHELVLLETAGSSTEWLDPHDTVVGFVRGPLVFLLNTGNDISGLPPICEPSEVLFASAVAEEGTIPANGALVLRIQPSVG